MRDGLVDENITVLLAGASTAQSIEFIGNMGHEGLEAKTFVHCWNRSTGLTVADSDLVRSFFADCSDSEALDQSVDPVQEDQLEHLSMTGSAIGTKSIIFMLNEELPRDIQEWSHTLVPFHGMAKMKEIELLRQLVFTIYSIHRVCSLALRNGPRKSESARILLIFGPVLPHGGDVRDFLANQKDQSSGAMLSGTPLSYLFGLHQFGCLLTSFAEIPALLSVFERLPENWSRIWKSWRRKSSAPLYLRDLLLEVLAPETRSEMTIAGGDKEAVVASKRLLGLLDVYSRPLNPWRLVPTYGVADASDMSEVRALFRKYGICVIHRAYNSAEAKGLYELGKQFANLTDIDVVRIARRGKLPFAGGKPALVDPRFWRYIAHPNVKSMVKEIFGGVTAVEIDTSMSAHHSVRGLHRDFASWFQNPANSYNLENGTNTVLRVLTYPAQAGMPAGTFGFIPFSHRKDLFNQQAARCGIKRPFHWYDTHRQIARQALEDSSSAEVEEELEELESQIVWVHLEAGDVLLVDARTQHCGDCIVGPQYQFVMSFGSEDLKTKTVLQQRWAAPLQNYELAYYEYLNTEGLCSNLVLEECRRAALRHQVSKTQPAAPGRV